jgi:hypothetical protein
MVPNLARLTVCLAVTAVALLVTRRLAWEPRQNSTATCPAARGDAQAQAAIDAYEAIAAGLERGDTGQLGRHAMVIANFFAPMNHEISRSARRLATARDLPAARREFARLARLFMPEPPIAQSTPPRA